MGFQKLKENFEREIPKNLAGDRGVAEVAFRYWQLQLLFEIAGNLDSLVVATRQSEKHIDRMSTAYCELVEIQKARNAK